MAIKITDDCINCELVNQNVQIFSNIVPEENWKFSDGTTIR